VIKSYSQRSIEFPRAIPFSETCHAARDCLTATQCMLDFVLVKAAAAATATAATAAAAAVSKLSQCDGKMTI
jgi:hypothetical protein